VDFGWASSFGLMFFFLIFTVQWWLTRLIYSALVWGSSAKHKPQRVGKVYSIPSCVLGLFFFFFFLNCKFLFLLNSFISHLLIEYMTGSSYTLGTWARGWGCCSDNQKGVSVGTIEQATVERIFEHRVRLLLWDLFHIIPSYARSKQSMSSLFHLEIR
jgi:hypothetical protein